MVLDSFMVWRGPLVHLVWVGSLQGAGFPLVSVARLPVSGGLQGAALPFAVVWVCGLEGAVVSLALVAGLEWPLVSFS